MTFEPNPLAVGVMAASMAPRRPVATKTCARCNEAVPVSEFGKHAKSKDGLQSYCKPCNREASRIGRKKRLQKEARKQKARLRKEAKMAAKNDPVNNPSHYQQAGIECIDAMVQVFGEEAVRTYARINAFKYQWRAPYKGKTAEDYEKALWYLRFAAGDDPRKDRSNG